MKSSDYALVIQISGALDKSLSRSVKEAQGLLNGLEGGSQKGPLGSLMTGLGKAASALSKASVASLGAIGTATVAAGTAATKTGMDFENAMADLAGTLGIDQTTDTFLQLEEAARDVGATTNKTATEAAQALKYMALASWDAETSMDALESMVMLSSASGIDLARTSDLVTDSYSTLLLSMDEYEGYMNMVAKADSAANYSAEQFMETMIGAGGAARTLGVNLNEFATAAGILANNGTKGAEAGTALNSMFTRFAGNDKALEALGSMNIKLYDANDQFIGMASLLGQIKEGLAGMNAETRNATMKDLFGTNYMSEGKYLLDSINSDGSWEALALNLKNAYNGMDEQGNAISTLQERYRVATNTLKGDLDILTSAASDFGIEIYKAMVGDENGGLRGAVQEATVIVGDLKAAFTEGGLDGLAEEVGNTIGALASEIGTKGEELVNSGFSFADTLINSIGSKDNAAKIGAAAAGIVTAIGTNFLTYTGDFAVAGANLIQGLAEGLASEDAGGKIADAATTIITKLGGWFSENAGSFGETAGTLISQLAIGLSENAGDILSAGIDIALGLARGLIQGAVVLVGNIPAIIGNLVSAIIENIPNMFNAGLALAGALADGIASAGASLAEAVSGVLNLDDDVYAYEEYANESAENLANVRAAMQELLSGQDMSGMAEEAREIYAETLSALADGTKSLDEVIAAQENAAYGSMEEFALNEVLNNYQYLMEQAVEMARNMPPAVEESAAAVEGLAETVQAESAGISEETQAAIDAAKEGVTGLEGVSANMQSEFDSLKASAQETSTAVTEALNTDLASSIGQNALGGLVQAANDGTLGTITEALNGSMATISAAVSTAAAEVSTTVTGTITDISTGISEGLLGIVTTIIDYNAQISTETTNIGLSLMQGLADGITANSLLAIGAAQAVADQIKTTIRSALQVHSPSQAMREIGQYTSEGLALGITDRRGTVSDAASAAAETAMGSMSAGVLESDAGPGTMMGGDIIFSPQITIQGNASEQDVRKVINDAMAEFAARYDRLMAERRRAAF